MPTALQRKLLYKSSCNPSTSCLTSQRHQPHYSNQSHNKYSASIFQVYTIYKTKTKTKTTGSDEGPLSTSSYFKAIELHTMLLQVHRVSHSLVSALCYFTNDATLHQTRSDTFLYVDYNSCSLVFTTPNLVAFSYLLLHDLLTIFLSKLVTVIVSNDALHIYPACVIAYHFSASCPAYC